MSTIKARTVRCAIYSRVSTEHGLDQEFNSLDAQYEASQAYIKSQAHAGWTLIRTRYEDGGYSGGSTERPALQNLLSDIRDGKIDVIVVYKVDRLTRSLADFAKLVELFDAHGVSFVSVTQQFNTTTSMGRLTLNVLLSFAQFEREVTSERIRDKIAASKRKGLWVGGMAPLGYDTKDRVITVNEAEAESVRLIFRRYLELGSLNRLMADLRTRGVVTKCRALKSGQPIGGIPFTRGPLAYLLRNRFYIGEVMFKGEVLPGEQLAIIDRDLFEAVQAKLSQQVTNHKQERTQSGALISGLIVDDRGNRMGPSYTTKGPRKYRYYISNPLIQGEPINAGSVSRIPADEVESAIITALRKRLTDAGDVSDKDLIDQNVQRVTVRTDRLEIELKPGTGQVTSKGEHAVIEVAWSKPPFKRQRNIMLPLSALKDVKPIRAETRASLVAAVAKGRQWLEALISGRIKDPVEIAARERCSVRKVEMTISLAFLAPDLIKAAIDGRLPRGIGMVRLYDLPAEWSRQFSELGLPASQM